MTRYTPPVQEYVFILHSALRDEYARAPGAEQTDGESLAAILDGFGRFVADQVVPLQEPSDVQGCILENGVVRAPDGYRDAYRKMMDDGWSALHVPEEDGGQGLPITVAFAGDEFLSSGSIGFSLYPALTLGVFKALQALGQNLDPAFREKLGSGEWAGTMCLTEAQSGTDLALIRTEAAEQLDGSYLISGTKIFISGGDHDITANIVHLVLAHIKGAAKGLRGLGLFVVPKMIKSDDDQWTVPNNVRCGRLEEKLGIHSSATAELIFENARGHLLGDAGAGLAGMFVIMKMARVGTGFQALGAAEIAYQHAISYARERIQGRDLTGQHGDESIAIIHHPNVRRELLRMRTLVVGARMLAIWTAITFDEADAANPEQRLEAETLLSVLMPISKVVASETGVEVATAAMHVMGGHGYIRDHGVEAILRDASILPIYEGTNDIQALDVVLRRLGANDGRAIKALFAFVERELIKSRETPGNPIYIARVAETLGCAKEIGRDLATRLASNPFSALQMAKDFVWLLGHVAIGALWLRVSACLSADGDLAIDRKIKAAEAAFYFAYLHRDADLRVARLRSADAIQDALRVEFAA